jgi:hypothetical protein
MPASLIGHWGHMKPGLRGRYWVQSPNSRVDSSTIGKAMRIPCSIARLRGAVLVPGMNADTCEAPLSAARLSAVANAGLCWWLRLSAHD